jgi:hypothetical protein
MASKTFFFSIFIVTLLGCETLNSTTEEQVSEPSVGSSELKKAIYAVLGTEYVKTILINGEKVETKGIFNQDQYKNLSVFLDSNRLEQLAETIPDLSVGDSIKITNEKDCNTYSYLKSTPGSGVYRFTEYNDQGFYQTGKEITFSVVDGKVSKFLLEGKREIIFMEPHTYRTAIEF